MLSLRAGGRNAIQAYDGGKWHTRNGIRTRRPRARRRKLGRANALIALHVSILFGWGSVIGTPTHADLAGIGTQKGDMEE